MTRVHSDKIPFLMKCLIALYPAHFKRFAKNRLSVNIKFTKKNTRNSQPVSKNFLKSRNWVPLAADVTFSYNIRIENKESFCRKRLAKCDQEKIAEGLVHIARRQCHKSSTSNSRSFINQNINWKSPIYQCKFYVTYYPSKFISFWI